MRLSDIYNSLRATTESRGANVDFGKTGKTIPLPAVIYDVTSERGVAADNKLYFKGLKTIEVELYSRRYDAALEAAVEEALDSLGIIYTKVCSWDNDGDFYLIVWTFEDYIEPESSEADEDSQS